MEQESLPVQSPDNAASPAEDTVMAENQAGDIQLQPSEEQKALEEREAARDRVIARKTAEFRTARMLGRSGLTLAEVRALKAIRRSDSLR
jgi:hypothetical protein